MIQKIALTVGGLGAAAVLAFALGLTNFVFAGPGATKQTADSQLAAQAADVSVAAAGNAKDSGGAGANQQTQTQTKKVVDKVYIAPTPAPKVVHVTPQAPNTKSAPAAQPAQPRAPTATPAWHDDNSRESEVSGRHRGHESGDD